MKTIIIGIAGGTGSGKSTFTRKLKKEFKDDVAVLYHDNYYRDQSDIPLEERRKTNYDHPDAMETELLIRQLMDLKAGKAVDCPVYDYTQHTRSDQVVRVEPKKVILLEGILVLADETANPHFVAADLLSQAEHDELACAILITTSEEFAAKVDEEVKGFVEVLSRKEIIQKSLDNFGYILIAEDMDEAIEAANEIAPEHMEIVTANPFEDMMKVKNAGAIFIGEYSSEPLGDYFAGPNHVLPTNGTAKFFSALSVDDFIKKSAAQQLIMEAIVKDQKFSMREYDYKGDLDEFAGDNGYSDENAFVEKFGKDSVVKAMLVQKAQDYVIDHANIAYK